MEEEGIVEIFGPPDCFGGILWIGLAHNMSKYGVLLEEENIRNGSFISLLITFSRPLLLSPLYIHLYILYIRNYLWEKQSIHTSSNSNVGEYYLQLENSSEVFSLKRRLKKSWCLITMVLKAQPRDQVDGDDVMVVVVRTVDKSVGDVSGDKKGGRGEKFPPHWILFMLRPRVDSSYHSTLGPNSRGLRYYLLKKGCFWETVSCKNGKI